MSEVRSVENGQSGDKLWDEVQGANREERLDDMERKLLSAIQQLQEEYFKAAAPYAKRLIQIRNARSVKVSVTAEQLAAIQGAMK